MFDQDSFVNDEWLPRCMESTLSTKQRYWTCV